MIRRRRWMPDERQRVKTDYGRMTGAELGALLDRTERAVWREACRQGIAAHKRAEPVQWRGPVNRCKPMRNAL